MIKYFTLILLIAQTSFAASPPGLTTLKKLSEYGRTNTLNTNDLFGVSVQPGTGFEVPMGIPAINAALTLINQVNLKLNQLTTNGPFGNDFIYIGDSTVARSGAQTGVGNEWPALVMQSTNFSHYGQYINLGIGGTTLAQWTFPGAASPYYYSNLVSPFFPATKNRALLICDAGYNDLSDTFLNITNNLVNLWNSARSNNFKVVAVTFFLSQSRPLADRTLVTNINTFVRTNSAFYDYLFQQDLVITNDSQYKPDLVHPNALGNISLAARFQQDIIPPLSTIWNALGQPVDATYGVLTVNTQINAQALVINASAGLVPKPGVAVEYLGQVIQSLDRGLQGNTVAWTNLSIRAGSMYISALNGLLVTTNWLDFTSPGLNTTLFDTEIIASNTVTAKKFIGDGSGITNLISAQSPTNLYGNGFNFGVMTASSQGSNYIVNLTNSAYMSITNSLNSIVNFVHVTNGPGICYIRLKSPDINYFCYFPTNWAWISTNGLGLTGTTYTNYVQVSAHRTGLLTIRSWGGNNPTDVTAKFEVSAP